MDKKSFPLKTQSYIANAIYIVVAFIINANNNSNFVLFLSLTIMIIVHIVKSVYESHISIKVLARALSFSETLHAAFRFSF